MKFICDNINNYSKEEYNSFFMMIKEQKQTKIKKLINEDDKKRSILGEILLIKLLEQYNIDYNDINIYTNEYEKPFIKDIDLFFNISHSNDYVVIVASTKKVGIDIEKIRKVSKRTINQFATTKESKYIIEKNSNKRCFEIYTLKEAYFKCLGTNLNNIKNIEFILKDKKIKCTNNNVRLKLIYDINNYIIAICKNI